MTKLKPCKPADLLQSLRKFSGFECLNESKPLAEAEATCVDDFMAQFDIENQRTADAVGVTSQTVRKWRKGCSAISMDNACKLISYFADTDEYTRFVSINPDSLEGIIEFECGEKPASLTDTFCFQFIEKKGEQKRREDLHGAAYVENMALHELLSMASWQLNVRERRIIGRMMADMIESNKSGHATSADIELADAYMSLTDNLTAEPDSLIPHVKRALDAMEGTSKDINSYLRHTLKDRELAHTTNELRGKVEEQQAEIKELTEKVRKLERQRDNKQRRIRDLEDIASSI